MLENSVLSGIAAVIVAIFSAEWAFLSWQNRQFTKVFAKMDEWAEKILNKLEYHERHDDTRFSGIRDDLWTIRVSMAASGLDKVKPRAPKEKDTIDPI